MEIIILFTSVIGLIIKAHLSLDICNYIVWFSIYVIWERQVKNCSYKSDIAGDRL